MGAQSRMNQCHLLSLLSLVTLATVATVAEAQMMAVVPWLQEQRMLDLGLQGSDRIGAQGNTDTFRNYRKRDEAMDGYSGTIGSKKDSNMKEWIKRIVWKNAGMENRPYYIRAQ